MPHKGAYSTWPEDVKQAHREAVKRWRATNPEKYRASELLQQENRRTRYASDPEYRQTVLARKHGKDTAEKQKLRREEVKRKVFDYYGHACVCCGETEEMFLTLDHENNDGAQHKKLIGKGNGKTVGSFRVYLWIIANNYPSGFRTLCFNCNCGRQRNGGHCPHEKQQQSLQVLATTSSS